jgi:hypothetical protein
MGGVAVVVRCGEKEFNDFFGFVGEDVELDLRRIARGGHAAGGVGPHVRGGGLEGILAPKSRQEVRAWGLWRRNR